MSQKPQVSAPVIGVTPHYVDQYRKQVSLFAREMTMELVSNHTLKGDFLEWNPTQEQAISELRHHVAKLEKAIMENAGRAQITEYAADVANHAMACYMNFT